MIIYGTRLAKQNDANAAASVANKVPALTLVELDLDGDRITFTREIQSQTVENAQDTVIVQDQAVSVAPIERITGFTAQADGFVASVVATTSKGNFSRLLFTDHRSPKSKKISGFKASNHTVEALVAVPSSNQQGYDLLSVFSLNGGTPPFDMGQIDPQTGKVQFGADLALPELQVNQRLSNLTRSPDGTIYGTALSGSATRLEVTPTLVQLNLTEPSILTGRGTIKLLASLHIDHKPLQNDLLALAAAPSGQIFALADPNYEGTNSLFTVNAETGEMQFVKKFEVDKITFANS